jgi:hypothetical protein
MLKFAALAAALVATTAAVPAWSLTTVTYNFAGTAGNFPTLTYSNSGIDNVVTAGTYTVAPTALTSLGQITFGAGTTTIERAPVATPSQGGIGVKSGNEGSGESPQVDTNGSPNEVLRFLLGNSSNKFKLVSGKFNYVDANDTLRVYGITGTGAGATMSYIGFPGEFYDNPLPVVDTPMGGGATATNPGGQLNNNTVFTVNFANNLAAYNGFVFTSNSDSADGYRIQSLTFGVVPEAATWAMMVVGFGMMGATMRRRRTSLTFA